MSAVKQAATSRVWKRPPLISNPRLRWSLWLGAAVYLALAFGTMDVNWQRVAEGISQVGAVTRSGSNKMSKARVQSRRWQRRSTAKQLAIWFGWLVSVAIFVQCWHLISEKTIWMFVTDAPRQAADLAERMVPPKWPYMKDLWIPVWDTINIATLGTMLAILIAIPVAFCAAHNTTPSTCFVRPVALFIIVSSRSINSLIWALMLVTIIGPGVLAGVIAIGLRSIGFCAKLLYEAIEEIDPAQVEAITATGATRTQQLAFGIVPQILPALAYSAGTSTSASPRCSAWSERVASDCNWILRSQRWPELRYL